MSISLPKGGELDPTINVQNLLAAAVVRLDDLREAESRRVDERMAQSEAHNKELQAAEAKRIDAIRTVDVNAVAIANERAAAQATVLANQVQASAEVARALVASTATANTEQLASLNKQFSDRIALVERAQYEKQGTGAGMREMYSWIFAGFMAIVTIGMIMWGAFKK